MKTYLSFEELSFSGKKTRYWQVRSAQTGTLLGEVKWRAHWRKYCLYTLDSVFDERCLAEVVEFLRRAMAQHCLDREKARKARF